MTSRTPSGLDVAIVAPFDAVWMKFRFAYADRESVWIRLLGDGGGGVREGNEEGR